MLNVQKPEIRSRRRNRSLRDLIARVGLEVSVLEVLSDSDIGYGHGEILNELAHKGVTIAAEELSEILSSLVVNNQACRYDGGVYAITDLGRSRLAPTPPVCVLS